MKSSLQYILLLCLPVTVLGQQTINGTITHDGLQREYILYVPATYSPGVAAPLVLNFHGYTSNAFQQMHYGDFRPIADTAGFLVVHPMGTVDLLTNTHWNVGWGTSTVNDVGFTAALIDSLSAAYTIDQERVYSTGMSNGGFMSYRLACELSHRIAAIASVTGSMTINLPNSCSPSHPMPVMEIHGTTDPTVPYNGLVLFQSIPSVLNFWSNFNATDTPPTITTIDDTDPNDGSTVEHHLYPNGNNGVEVEHYKVINGAHTWPGTFFSSAGTNHDIDASSEIWRFFSQYDIHGRINTTSISNAKKTPDLKVFPNPTQNIVWVQSDELVPSAFVISTMLGQPVISGRLTHTSSQIDLSGLQPGIYILTLGSKSVRIVKTL